MGSLHPGKGEKGESVKHPAVEDNNLSRQLEAEGWDENRKDIQSGGMYHKGMRRLVEDHRIRDF